MRTVTIHTTRTWRLWLILAVAAVALAGRMASPAPSVAAAPQSYGDADYWALADRISAGFDAQWDQNRRAYVVPQLGTSIRHNANLLTAHAVAALRGHQGASRRDERALALVDRMTSRPAWRGNGRLRPPTVKVGRPSACWATDMDSGRQGHLTLESKVADALAWAWRARRALGMSSALATRIRRAVDDCAHDRLWRYPALMGNQINWYGEMYASAATVTRSGALLRTDYRQQLERFTRAISRPMRGKRASNLGTGYGFHYQVNAPANAPVNLDSPEYANIVLHAISHYGPALRAGMRPLSRQAMQEMRAWATRVLAGYWTHAGYLNWDTGLGLERLHSAQYWAFAQQGLLAMATSPKFWSNPSQGRWAKALFDRGLTMYRRLADEAGTPLAPQRMFGIQTEMEDQSCFSSRMLANAARAIGLGLGSQQSEEPPPLYSFDADTGRLAVSTPRYSTSIVPDNRGAFAYGGGNPTRLLGPDGRAAAGVGGSGPAAFGITVNGAGGRDTRLRLTRAPQANGRLRAGPFGEVETTATSQAGSAQIQSTHRFTADAIESTWGVDSREPGQRVAANFPTWGGDARIELRRRDGSVTPLAAGSAPVPLAEIDELSLGGDSGYTLQLLRAPANATLTAVAVPPERTNPNPGPTLAIEMANGEPGHAELAVRLSPR